MTAVKEMTCMRSAFSVVGPLWMGIDEEGNLQDWQH